MNVMIKIKDILIFLFVYILLITSCNKHSSVINRHSIYYKYRNYYPSSPNLVEVFFIITADEWESDYLLNIYSYNDTVIENDLQFDKAQLFKELLNKKKSSKLLYTLNFDADTSMIGVHNLKRIKWLAREKNRIPIFMFKYLPEEREDDANSNIYYNPDFGIIAEYSSSWNNLVLIDSIFGDKKYSLKNVRDELIKDTLFFPNPK